MIIELRCSRHDRESLQEIAQGVAGDSEKRQQASRLNVAIRVLLKISDFATELHEMSAGGVSCLINDLIGIRDAVLRIVVLVAKRRKAGQADERQSLRSVVEPDLRQPDLRV